MTGDTLKALTTASVLLGLVLLLGTAWIRDRNARIDDMRRYADQWRANSDEWRKAHETSETARELEREKNAETLAAVKLTNALLSGFRQARDWAGQERGPS